MIMPFSSKLDEAESIRVYSIQNGPPWSHVAFFACLFTLKNPAAVVTSVPSSRPWSLASCPHPHACQWGQGWFHGRMLHSILLKSSPGHSWSGCHTLRQAIYLCWLYEEKWRVFTSSLRTLVTFSHVFQEFTGCQLSDLLPCSSCASFFSWSKLKVLE